MKTATVRYLRYDFPKLESWLAGGEEILISIELPVWLHSSDRKKGYSRREADQMIEDWETDIASGLNKVVPYDSDAVLRLATSCMSQLLFISEPRNC
jgi:hypothetical protein